MKFNKYLKRKQYLTMIVSENMGWINGNGNNKIEDIFLAERSPCFPYITLFYCVNYEEEGEQLRYYDN